MRRAIYKRNPSKAIGITLAAILVTGALFCAGFFVIPFDKNQVSETKEMDKIENYSAPVQKGQTVSLEIVTADQPIMNREKKNTNISASRQSSLEKAIDELIELTESDG